MQAYSEIVAEARAYFLRMQEHGVRTTEDILELWSVGFAIGQKFAEYSPLGGIRFAQADFDSSTWKLASKLFEPLVKAGCVERRQGDRRIGGALVLKPDVTNEVLATAVKPKREYKKKVPEAQATPVVEKVVQRVVEKPKRKEAPESRAVVIDLANVTKRRDASGRLVLPINRINWNALRNVLQMHHGESVPLERLVLCVSAHYYADNRSALACAERAGFSVVTKYGEKEADPVVVCELMNIVHKALIRDYADRIPTIVLVSGDADFSGVIHSLREAVKWEGLALPLHVVSWMDSLSLALDLNASKTTAMEDILRLIRLP